MEIQFLRDLNFDKLIPRNGKIELPFQSGLKTLFLI